MYMNTQWRCGPVGFYGLDYSVLFQKLDHMNLDPDSYEEIENDIRKMEVAALEEMSGDER